MLVLSRFVGENLVFLDPEGRKTIVTILSNRDNQVRIGITAPRDVQVHREEVYERIQREGYRGDGQ